MDIVNQKPALPPIAERLNFIRMGGRTQRYHTRRRSHPECVAQHVYGVLGFLYLITDGTARPSLIWAATFHDTAEFVGGDLPADGKRRLSPQFKTEFDAAEADLLSANGLMMSLEPWEGYVLKLCDNLDGLWSCVDERQSGNQMLDGVFRNYRSYLAAAFAHWETLPEDARERAVMTCRAWELFNAANDAWHEAGGKG